MFSFLVMLPRTSTIKIPLFFDHISSGREDNKTPCLFIYFPSFIEKNPFFRSFLIPCDIFFKFFSFYLDLKSLVIALVWTIFLDLET